ncbi:STAS domain-containing protein [Dactylosporangium sp. NPDC005555]|uniref:STAS domain-containing protein n=1 Tax=Dactylosporangium sp. NPDC005555 TaxID=3154889 RepID=UPI0033A0358D
MDVAVTERPDGVVLVRLLGALDIDSAPLLREAMHRALDSGQSRIVVDLGGVEFCDSVGLGTFAYSHNRCVADGGFLRLAAPSPFLAGLLETVGLSGRIPVHATVSDALPPALPPAPSAVARPDPSFAPPSPSPSPSPSEAQPEARPSAALSGDALPGGAQPGDALPGEEIVR